jgi:hypothetical protein
MKKTNNIDIRFNTYNIILDFIMIITSQLNIINLLDFVETDNLENKIKKILNSLLNTINDYVDKKIIKIKNITDAVCIEIIIPTNTIKKITTISIFNIDFSLFLNYNILNSENKKVLVIKKYDDIFINNYTISLKNLFNSIQNLDKLIKQLIN